MKTFLCVEHGEFFTIEAKDFAEAQEDASMWGGSAVREMTQDEVEDGEVKA